MLTLLKVKKRQKPTAIPPKHFKHVANKNQHLEPPPPSQSHQCRARLPGGAPAWSRPCWGPSVGDTLIEVPLGGFLLPFQRVSQEKWHIISQWLARQGRQKEQEVKTPLRGQLGSTQLHPGRLEGASWDQFGSFFPPLHLQTSCHFLFALPQRLEAAVKLRPLRPPRLPTPPRWSSSGPKGSGNQSGKT